MSEQNILTKRDGDHVVILTINHPPANAWNLTTAQDFERALDDIENDRSVRVVIITGAGVKCFSAGFDLSDAANADAVSGLVQKLWRRVDRFDKPIIAAINGAAMGGGCELAMSCHFRIMSDHPGAKIGLTELNLGIIPGWGGTQRMAKIIGRAHALDMILFSKRLTAEEAKAIGLVTRVSPADALLENAIEFAHQLAARPPIAVRAVLRAMSEGEYAGIDAGLALETAAAKDLQSSSDAAEGITAFFEKRTPVFTGE